jgi:hypothetical protein
MGRGVAELICHRSRFEVDARELEKQILRLPPQISGPTTRAPVVGDPLKKVLGFRALGMTPSLKRAITLAEDQPLASSNSSCQAI